MPRSVYQDLEKFRERVEKGTKILETLLEQDAEQLRKEINSTLGCGPNLYFYQKTVSRTKHASSREIETLLLDDQFIELLYATLASWGMHSRGAKMKSFGEFSRNIRKNVGLFIKLAEHHLEDGLSDSETVKTLLELFSSLDIMRSRKKANREASKLVANSKLMHFILPNLVMPIDRTHTVEFFKGCRQIRLPPHMSENWEELDGENKNDVRTFFKIHQAVSELIQKQRVLRKLQALVDNEWNQTIPKVIDNLIIYYYKKHQDKCK